MSYDWDFTVLLYYAPAFGKGVVVTLQLAVLASILGTLGGIPLGAALRLPGIRLPTQLVVDVIRGTPNLVLIFLVYYFPTPEVFGVQSLSGFSSVLLALVVAQAAYTADLLRAAIGQVPRTQEDGLRAMGLTEWDVARFVKGPSLARQLVPAHVALWIGNLKLTSLASVIGVEDVVYVAKVSMSQSFRSLEAWLFVAAIYVVIVIPATYLLRLLERSAWISRQ